METPPTGGEGELLPYKVPAGLVFAVFPWGGGNSECKRNIINSRVTLGQKLNSRAQALHLLLLVL